MCPAPREEPVVTSSGLSPVQTIFHARFTRLGGRVITALQQAFTSRLPGPVSDPLPLRETPPVLSRSSAKGIRQLTLTTSFQGKTVEVTIWATSGELAIVVTPHVPSMTGIELEEFKEEFFKVVKVAS